MYAWASYPLYVNVWNKEVMDTHRATMVGVEPANDKAMQLEAQNSNVEDPSTHTVREVR
jgi:FHS family L-fucose permease-like MFS transporter